MGQMLEVRRVDSLQNMLDTPSLQYASQVVRQGFLSERVGYGCCLREGCSIIEGCSDLDWIG